MTAQAQGMDEGRGVQVLVTRPAIEAARWIAQLQAQGIRAAALPLIDIAACQDAASQAALRQAHARLAHYQAVMFVSVPAVRHFLMPNLALAPEIPALAAMSTRAWAPGPGTARALLQAGWPAARLDAPPAEAAQFDSEALWQRVAPQVQPGARVLVVRGREAGSANAAAGRKGQGRDWLAQQIEAAGGVVETVVAYERAAPHWSPEQVRRAHAAVAARSWWLLSSSLAVHHLRQTLPDLPLAQARALATHPRIAAAARAAGFGQVRECRPTVQDVVAALGASIESAP
ncbi:uroporphyrinogen-III synthase [Extensimonas vulgaris]|uniref:Uroporphyrinogen-III synthase n=1 Tax=Extensimonas vulgaris TaxID=1031594 RepID=A0A369AGN6_9BURK|nr:uroporphyrinogen-III synthase [Extensimonas vulgaris]RCX08520.1 uroporphyrinogen-III synthase [Extensimonas vulgaris]TWI34878.1 uroporphyrinogen-III synthase [Extensimonas vulgaris]